MCVPTFSVLCAVPASISPESCHEIGGGMEEEIKIIKVDQPYMWRLRNLRLERWLRRIMVKVCYQLDNMVVELFNTFHTT